MTLDEFAALSEAEWQRLPAGVRALTSNAQLVVADEADPETLAEMGMSNPLEVLGLFEGEGMGDGGWTPQTATFPTRISLIRLPILAYAEERDDGLDAIVRHVLVHEIGHHFGLSDADMAAIDGEDYA